MLRSTQGRLLTRLGPIIVLFVFLLYTPLLPTRAVAPACFPGSVMNQADLNAAIVCYNSLVVPGTYDINIGANILLTASTTPINNATAGVSLVINGANFAVDGQSLSGVRVFNIATSTTVEMKSLIVRNGNITAANGAGILNAGNLTLTNSTVSGNAVLLAAGGDVAGGGIYNVSGALTLTNSTVSGNTVTRTANVGTLAGGGIYSLSGAITLTNSTVSGNTVTAIAGSVAAGGIYSGGPLTLTNSTVSNNTASKENAGGGSAQGGGILLWGTGTLTNSTISGNSVVTNTNNSFAQGGGIYNGGASLTLTNSTVSGNIANSAFGTSARGGGIYNIGTSLTLTNSTISLNTATTGGISGRGGGIYNESGTTTLTNSTLSGNTAAGLISLGGGIGNTGVLVISFSTLYKNSAETGGGINIIGGAAQVENSIIAHTASENGDDCAITGTLTAVGNNIGSDGSCTGFSLLNTDPNLAALALNGGTTQTHLPNPGSPAINGVTGSCPASDQRGVARPQDTLCDIGSVEAGTSGPVTRIVIEKQTSPEGDTTEFEFTGEITAVLQDNETAQKDVLPGQYTVSEIVPAGWDLMGVACDDTNSTGSLASASATINVEEGETVTCTFNNAKEGQGYITILKETIPDGDLTNFTFYPSIYSDFVLKDGSSFSSGLIPANTIYTFTEMVPAGWELTSIVCDDNDSTGSVESATASVSLQADESVTCTFTNTKKPTTSITVKKVTGPAPYDVLGYDFQFYFNTFNFQLDTDEVALDKPSSRTFADLQPGSYRIREASVNPNFYLKSVTCVDGSTVVLQHTNTQMANYSLQVFVPLLQGQSIVCTFENERRGDIQIRKFEDLNGNGQYTRGEPWLDGWVFTVYQNGVQVGQTFTSNDNGKVNVNNLIPGTYEVCETPQAGWNPIPCVSVTVPPLGRLKVDMPNTRVVEEQSAILIVADDDGDGVANDVDVCTLGDDRVDSDADGTADACDSTPTGDTDSDGIDNAVDTTPNGDTDNDSVDNSEDVCATGDDRVDSDADGTADACDSTPTGDTDSDGIDNAVDPTPNGDTDNDGVDNSADVCATGDDRVDTDADGTADACDSTPTGDTDSDGIDNAVDPTPNGDTDNDGVDNSADVCALGYDRVDTDADGTADACDSTPTGDTDSDGIDNAVDTTPNGDTDNDGIDNAVDPTPNEEVTTP